jgi:hypothetical protein
MNDLPNFDPLAVADEIAALETEAQDKLAEAKDEFKSRSEKIAAILWDVKQHRLTDWASIEERAANALARAAMPISVTERRPTRPPAESPPAAPPASHVAPPPQTPEVPGSTLLTPAHGPLEISGL